MTDYSSVDFSKPRRPTGPLTPTDIDDVQKFILKPLQDAGFRLNKWASENYQKYLRLIRNGVFDYEYTKGNDTSVFETVLRGLDYDENAEFNAIAENGVKNYANALQRRDKQKLTIQRKTLTKTLLQSTDTPFKKLPVGRVADITKYAIGGRRTRKTTRNRRKTRRV